MLRQTSLQRMKSSRDMLAQVAEQALNTTAADIDAFMAEDVGIQDTAKTVAEELAASDRSHRREHEHPSFYTGYRSRTVS